MRGHGHGDDVICCVDVMCFWSTVLGRGGVFG